MITLTDDDLISIIDQVTVAVGEILATHAELKEGLMDKTATNQFQKKIDGFKKKAEEENEKLKNVKTAQQRRDELLKINRHNAKRTKNESTTAQRLICLKNSRGQVAGWIRRVSPDRTNVMDRNGRLVAFETGDRTFTANGQYFGNGSQGIRVLGLMEKAKEGMDKNMK